MPSLLLDFVGEDPKLLADYKARGEPVPESFALLQIRAGADDSYRCRRSDAYRADGRGKSVGLKNRGSSACNCAPRQRVHRRNLLYGDYFVIVEDMRRRGYLGQLELLVLLAAIQRHDNAYGVSIARAIEESSGRTVALASVYAALERLEGKGLITSVLGEPTAERGGKARTYFKASPAGLKEAREAHATLLRLSAGLPELKGQII